jgi:glutathione S-transferase
MKLVYFNGRGLAETSRVLFAVAGVDYEDFRYPLTVLDWSIFKMIREEFDNDKKEGKLWDSFDKLPRLEVDGQVIFQSKSIERFIANQYGLFGTTPIEAAFIDSICETIRDFKDSYLKLKNTPSETKDAVIHTYFSETLPPLLFSLNNIIKSKQPSDEITSDTFVIGKKISLADIVLFLFFTDFFDNKEVVTGAYEKFPYLKAIVDNVGHLDSVKNWLANRPQTPF